MDNQNKKNEKITTIAELAVLINSGFQTAKEQTDKRFDEVDKRFDEVDKRFDEVDKRFDVIEGRLDNIENVLLEHHSEEIEDLKIRVRNLESLKN